MDATSYLLRLPASLLSKIAQRSQCQQSLRCTCKALREAISPASIQLTFANVKHGHLDLQLSSRLATTWHETRHITVSGEDFNDAIKHRNSDTNEHIDELQDYFHRVVAALVYWKQFETASVPLNSSILTSLMVNCQLQLLELSDSTFTNEDADFPEERIVRYQVLPCLQLLQGCSSLKRLTLELSVARIEPQHLQRLGQLSQLEDLNLVLSNEDHLAEPFLVYTHDIVHSLGSLTQLVNLSLNITQFCNAVSVAELQLGSFPHMRTMSIALENYGGIDCILGPTAFSGCTQLEQFGMCSINQHPTATWSVLHKLVHLEVPGQILEDSLMEALTNCPCLQYLEVGEVYLTAGCSSVLAALHDLRINMVNDCKVHFHPLVPALKVFKNLNWHDHLGVVEAGREVLTSEMLMIKCHPLLTTLNVPFSWILEGHLVGCAALTSLTSLRSLQVDLHVMKTPQESVRIAQDLLPWLGKLRNVQIVQKRDWASAEHVLVLLKALSGLEVLWIGTDTDESTMSKMAQSVVWAIAVCSQEMLRLRAVSVQLSLLMSRDGEAGGLSYVTEFLVGLARAPCVNLVQLLQPSRECDETTEFREGVIQKYVSKARRLQPAPFHVEVLCPPAVEMVAPPEP